MTYGAFTQDFAPYDCVVRSRRPFPQMALCAAALVATTSVGLWALYSGHNSISAVQVAEMAPVSKIPAKTMPANTAAPAPARTDASIATAALKAVPEQTRGLLDPTLTTNYGAVVFARSMPLRSGGESRSSRSPVIANQAQAAALPAALPIVSPIQVAAVPPALPASPLLPHVARSEPAPAPQPRVALAEPIAALPQAAEEVDVPLPLPRPASLARSAAPDGPVQRRVASQMADVGAVPAAPAAENPSFFDKLFSRPKDNGQVLAYAAPEDGLIGNVFKDTVGRPAAPDRYTAVYNITTHTVTLPDGTRLEAHSGLGAAKDNPRMVTLRMVGATPPNVYDLTPREAIFHGVRALRLTPTGGTTFGRAGLLTHSYMLRGRSGESNGCVVFRDYPAFLRAYDSGMVRRLAVVAGA